MEWKKMIKRHFEQMTKWQILLYVFVVCVVVSINAYYFSYIMDRYNENQEHPLSQLTQVTVDEFPKFNVKILGSVGRNLWPNNVICLGDFNKTCEIKQDGEDIIISTSYVFRRGDNKYNTILFNFPNDTAMMAGLTYIVYDPNAGENSYITKIRTTSSASRGGFLSLNPTAYIKINGTVTYTFNPLEILIRTASDCNFNSPKLCFIMSSQFLTYNMVVNSQYIGMTWKDALTLISATANLSYIFVMWLFPITGLISYRQFYRFSHNYIDTVNGEIKKDNTCEKDMCELRTIQPTISSMTNELEHAEYPNIIQPPISNTPAESDHSIPPPPPPPPPPPSEKILTYAV